MLLYLVLFALFYILSPGIFLSLPRRGSKQMVALTHAIVFVGAFYLAERLFHITREGFRSTKRPTLSREEVAAQNRHLANKILDSTGLGRIAEQEFREKTMAAEEEARAAEEAARAAALKAKKLYILEQNSMRMRAEEAAREASEAARPASEEKSSSKWWLG